MPAYDRFEDLRVTVAGGVLTCTLNRPEARNAYTPATLEEIYALCREAAVDETVRVVVLTGAGSAFCVGGDVRGFVSGATDVNAMLQQSMTQSGAKGFASLPQPVIASVNGDAVGGGINFALQCDVILAAENARFGFAYSRLGLSPSADLLTLAPMLANPNRAKEYIFSGETFSAHEAERIGIVNHVHPAGELASATSLLAASIAATSPLTNRWAKLLVNKEIEARSNMIRTAASALMALSTFGGDYREGARAFLEKRTPEFKGR